MPVSEYFSGHGAEVMRNMKKQYGEKKGKSVFYATAHARGEKPAADERAEQHEWLDRRLDARADDEHIGFEKLKEKLAHRKGVRDPGAVAAAIGREKYGKAGMAKKAAAGRAKDDAEHRQRLHRALDRVIDDVLDRRALKALQILRGQTAEAFGE